MGVKAGDKLLVAVRRDNVIVLRKPPAPHAAIRGLRTRSYPEGYLHKERQSWD